MNIAKNIDRSLEKLHPRALLGISYLLVPAITYLDYVTGYEYSMSLFFLVPIFLGTWYYSREHGLALSFLSVAGWLIVDNLSHEHSHQLVPVWNAIMHLGFYVVVTMLLSIIRNTLDREVELAMNDFLTGIPNSRSFFERADAELKRARRYDKHLMLAYMDLDNFKSVNDSHGHLEGDRLLMVVASTVKDNIRESDIVARLGGDEFVILIPELTSDHSLSIIEKIMSKLLGEMEKNGWPVTFSIGSIFFQALPESVPEMIKMADNLMYEAKKNGKNMIQVKEYS